MNFNTTRFGEINLPDEQIISFPEGLLGFEQETSFTLLPFIKGSESPLDWLQSTKTPELAFVVTDPTIFIPEYPDDLLKTENTEIKIRLSQNFILRVIVTIPTAHIEMTANLAGPLVISQNNKIGKQFVITTSKYDTKYFLFPEDARNSKTNIT